MPSLQASGLGVLGSDASRNGLQLSGARTTVLSARPYPCAYTCYLT